MRVDLTSMDQIVKNISECPSPGIVETMMRKRDIFVTESVIPMSNSCVDHLEIGQLTGHVCFNYCPILMMGSMRCHMLT